MLGFELLVTVVLVGTFLARWLGPAMYLRLTPPETRARPFERRCGQVPIRRDGTQKNVLDTMQTRADLYDYLDYHAYEDKLDQLFAKDKHR